ncbi:MAG: class D beta-lactamase [Syntrophobacteraceae bacterium]
MELSKRQKTLLLGLCLFGSMAVKALAGVTETAPPTLPPIDPARVAVPAVELRPDFKKYFDAFNVKGAFVLFAVNANSYVRYNPERCEERFLPASTFKVLSALMALEAGVVQDESTMLPWDGTQYQIAAWNRDQTLKSAMASSVVWYYQELARRMGKERMQRFVDEVGYGNRSLSGPVDSFWLDGGLRISADEQVEFLRRLYQGDLPFSERSMEIVKRILVLEETPGHRLSGKTGAVQRSGQPIGWYVGALEKAGQLYCFATNIEGANVDDAFLKARIDITRQILGDLGIM